MDSVRSAVADPSAATLDFNAESLAALRAALENRSAQLDPTSSPILQAALRHVCLEAKRKNWPPESLLIAFKKALHETSTVQRLSRGPDRDGFVERLVF